MRVVLAHIGGVPVEENLIYLGPVILIVGFIYLQGWRERRHPERYRKLDETRDDPDWGSLDAIEEPVPFVGEATPQRRPADVA